MTTRHCPQLSPKLPDKKYKVTLTVQARKLKSDGNGVETPMPLNDFIDIGIFAGKKDHEKVLYLKKEKFTHEKRDLRDSGRSDADTSRYRSAEQADRPGGRRQYDGCYETVMSACLQRGCFIWQMVRAFPKVREQLPNRPSRCQSRRDG